MKTRIIAISLFIVTISSLSFRSADRKSSVKQRRAADPNGTVYIIVDKSDYELSVYDDDGWYATYPVVFGNKDLSDKFMEGDKKTPEGTFRITSKRVHDKWHRMMLLDYPNKDSWAKFKQRKAAGLIPASAKIGGGIAIHGTWPNDDLVVDDYTNWTNGCVSLKNEDIDEINEYLTVGTKVIIRR